MMNTKKICAILLMIVGLSVSSRVQSDFKNYRSTSPKIYGNWIKLQYSRWIRRMSKVSNDLIVQVYHAKHKKRSDQVLYWFEKFVDLTYYNNNKNRIRLM